MGIRQIITDDLTGEEVPDGTVPTEVRVDGEDYSLYLGEDSKETFLALLRGEAPLLADAKPARVRTTKGAGRGNASKNTYGYDNADVRAWAIANGVKNQKKNGEESPVGDRGVMAQNVYDEYHAVMKGKK